MLREQLWYLGPNLTMEHVPFPWFLGPLFQNYFENHPVFISLILICFNLVAHFAGFPWCCDLIIPSRIVVKTIWELFWTLHEQLWFIGPKLTMEHVPFPWFLGPLFWNCFENHPIFISLILIHFYLMALFLVFPGVWTISDCCQNHLRIGLDASWVTLNLRAKFDHGTCPFSMIFRATFSKLLWKSPSSYFTYFDTFYFSGPFCWFFMVFGPHNPISDCC